MTLQGVMFDMDGLLIDTEPLWMAAELELVNRLGGVWTSADQAAILGLALPAASEYIRGRCPTDWSAEQVGQALVAGFLSHLDGGELVVQPGAVSLVSEVAASGLPFALVSASVREIVDLVTNHPSFAEMPKFPVTVAGDEVAAGKPDPTPYVTAAALLGVDPTRCVVLEDSANGVQAGWAAGATVVALSHMVNHEPRPRIHVRSTLEGLDVAELEQLVGA